MVLGVWSPSRAALYSRPKCALSQVDTPPDMTLDFARTSNSKNQTHTHATHTHARTRTHNTHTHTHTHTHTARTHSHTHIRAQITKSAGRSACSLISNYMRSVPVEIPEARARDTQYFNWRALGEKGRLPCVRLSVLCELARRAGPNRARPGRHD